MRGPRLSDLVGAFGDPGTLLPLAAGLVLVAGTDPGGSVFAFGLAIALGLFFAPSLGTFLAAFPAPLLGALLLLVALELLSSAQGRYGWQGWIATGMAVIAVVVNVGAAFLIEPPDLW